MIEIEKMKRAGEDGRIIGIHDLADKIDEVVDILNRYEILGRLPIQVEGLKPRPVTTGAGE